MDIREVGPALARHRKALGLTQEALCKDLAISRVTLSAFENGKNLSLSLRQLGRILQRLDLELNLQPRQNLPTLDDILAGKL